MKFYTAAVSGNAYKVRILLALLKIPHESVLLDFAKRDHKHADYLKINPRGEVPAIEDGGKVIWDSGACLVYIARKFGGEQWLPVEAAGLADVMQWLALAASEIQFGLQYARRGLLQGRWTAGTLEQGHALARVALDVHGMLARAADGEVLVPRFSLHDPVFLGGKEAGLPPIQ